MRAPLLTLAFYASEGPVAFAATRAEILASPAILLLGVPFFGTALGLTLAAIFIWRRDR